MLTRSEKMQAIKDYRQRAFILRQKAVKLDTLAHKLQAEIFREDRKLINDRKLDYMIENLTPEQAQAILNRLLKR